MISLVYCGSPLLQVPLLTGAGCGYKRTLTDSHIVRFTPPIILWAIISPSLSRVLEACLCYQQFIYCYWGIADHSVCELSSNETFIYSVAVYWKHHLNWESSLTSPGCVFLFHSWPCQSCTYFSVYLNNLHTFEYCDTMFGDNVSLFKNNVLIFN